MVNSRPLTPGGQVRAMRVFDVLSLLVPPLRKGGETLAWLKFYTCGCPGTVVAYGGSQPSLFGVGVAQRLPINFGYQYTLHRNHASERIFVQHLDPPLLSRDLTCLLQQSLSIRCREGGGNTYFAFSLE